MLNYLYVCLSVMFIYILCLSCWFLLFFSFTVRIINFFCIPRVSYQFILFLFIYVFFLLILPVSNDGPIVYCLTSLCVNRCEGQVKVRVR